MLTYALGVLTALILVTAQASLKHGLTRSGGIGDESATMIHAWIAVLTEPYVLAGMVLLGVAGLVWLRVLSELQLSAAYPIISLSYASDGKKDSQRGMHAEEELYLNDSEIIERLTKAGFQQLLKEHFWTQWGLNHLFVAGKIR